MINQEMMGAKEKDSFWNNKQTTASFLHSLSSFLAAYLIVYFLSGISVLYIAYDLDVPAKLFVNTIDFGLSQIAQPLTTDIIVSVFMAQPVSSFIMGIIALFLFMFIPRKTYWLQLFLLWFFLHGFNFSFGLVSEDLLLKTGLFNVAEAMELRQFMLILTAGIALFFLVKAGTLVGKLFYAYVYQPANPTKARLASFGYNFLLPWAIGSLIILGMSFQHNGLKDLLLRLSMLISLVPIIFVKTPFTKKLSTTKTPRIFSAISYLIITFGLLFLFVFLLKNGIRMG